MRNEFARLLHQKMVDDSSVYLLFGDLGYGLMDKIRADFPDRAINCGIAEQSMVAIAAGLACTGKTVFVYTISSFVLKCLEQIKLYLCGQNLKVIIIGSGAACSYGSAGITHHCMEDLGALSVLPGLEIYEPCDFLTTNKVVSDALENNGPSYIRFVGSSRAEDPFRRREVYPELLEGLYGYTMHGKFQPGAIVYVFGNVLAYSEVGRLASEVGARVESVFDFSKISPTSDKGAPIFSVEESFGGFGHRVQDLFSSKVHQIKAERRYIKGSYDHETLKRMYGLDYESIKAQIKEILYDN